MDGTCGRWQREGWAARRALICALAVAPAVAMGCDAGQRVQRAAVETHRHAATGRVGVLRALEVRDGALASVRRVARAGDSECPRLPEGPMRTELMVDATVAPAEAGEQNVARFHEETTATRDAQGRVDVTSTLRFVDPSGRTGTTQRTEICTSRWFFVAEQATPFVRRVAHTGECEALVARAVQGPLALLRLGGRGWQVRPDGSFVAERTEGGRALACDAAPGTDDWLRRLEQVARLSYSEAKLVEPGAAAADRGQSQAVALSVRLLTGPDATPTVVSVEIDGRVNAAQVEPIAEPTEPFDTRRDRPYRDLQTILGDRMGLPRWRRGQSPSIGDKSIP